MGALELSRALRINMTLKTLNLSCNKISDIGATALANALHVNVSLRILNCYLNDISDKGATAFARALHENTTLTKLDVHDNIIGEEGLTAFDTVLQTNTTLTILTLDDHECDPDFFYFPIFGEINMKIERNMHLYNNTYWHPYLHNDFPPCSYHLFLTCLLCNADVVSPLPILPFCVWKQVFSFFSRNYFY